MTRDEFTTIGKLDDAALALLTCVELTALEAMIAQGNAADVRVEAQIQTHNAEIAAKEQAIAEKEALINELGSTEKALELRKAREIVETRAAVIAAEAAKLAAEEKLRQLEAKAVEPLKPVPAPVTPPKKK